MTKDEILNMEAGSEMDALIAEKVMGQTNFNHPGFYWQEKNYADGDGWEGFYCPVCDASQGDAGKCCLRYSRDIAAAWQVVEKLDDLDGYGVWTIGSGGGIRGHWDVNLALSENESFWAWAATAPLAICRVALLAILYL